MSGPWRNGEFLNTNKISFGSDARLYYVSNETEQSFTYLTRSYDAFPALRMSESGDLEDSTLSSGIFCALSSSPVHAESKIEMLKCREDYIFYMGKNFHFQTISYIYIDEFEYHNLTLYDCKDYAGTIVLTQPKTGQAARLMASWPGKKKKKWLWLIIGVGSLAPVLLCYFIYKKLHLRGMSFTSLLIFSNKYKQSTKFKLTLMLAIATEL
ncbi:hypothetical protein L1987_23158 [Smallanthus sonchifolius]|uniref:Uncharacterized protein n=1 Tax=Smallanthus sonchifolius TaxID=185202 RepID=A0ACB9IG41_9ASTR|nr:hypothetical protein L1987_23158 [Smallanthus sonchifolius]